MSTRSTESTDTKFVADDLDRLLFSAFPGLVMRKGLTKIIRGTSKAPSYVIEFMLGKYCANLFDDEDVREGLRLVQEEVAAYIPRADETEAIKAAIRERPPRRVIDSIKVELDERLEEGVYWASLVTAGIRNVNISAQIVQKYERLLTAGVWCNVLLHYDDTVRYRNRTYPFVISRLEPVQVGRVDLADFCRGREQFTRDQWIDALLRTMGYEPTHPQISQRIKLLYLARMIPLVEGNYHMIELGPRQTGKSFCVTEFSPYGTLLAGGAITVPKLFVTNTSPPRPGLIALRDVVGFDEIAGSAFNGDDDKNLYKSYMEAGQINRGTITVAGDAGFVFSGNMEFDPREGMQADHLFKPLPPSVSDDAAFHDRWAAYLPGWEMPKLTGELLTEHVGFILDYTAELFHRELRKIGHYGSLWERWFEAPANQWSARDLRSVNRTFSGLTKLIFPSGEMRKEDARLLLDLALELRLRVRLQLNRINPQEFPLTEFSYRDRDRGVLETVATEV
ncbi:MAG TPA: BREX system Lon protease-like protein BrxL [Chloroflexota bacterium]|nr:BREX system Lon protease-like protein BrxL [Chloroflexota bacterium]